MLNAYGENVFDDFYSWLKLNEEVFADPYLKDSYYDISDLEYTYLYPHFYHSGNSIRMNKFYRFEYKDLYIGIDETRYYLEVYKNKNVSNMKLKLSSEVMVELYDNDNRLITSGIDKEFSLVGVSYIKLVGEGKLGRSNTHGLEIVY
jgi:hypothetical protein